MRNLFLAGALFLTAVPAAAQPDAGMDERGVAEALAHRGIDMSARAIDGAVGAIMALPIGNLAAPFDPYGRTPYGPGITVGDLAARGDPAAARRMREAVHAGARMAHAVTAGMVRAAPELRRSAERFGQDLLGILAAAAAGDAR